ncbi:MAG: hypothetical protein R3A10_10570 [Caldilineaceae bacterium]
MVIPSLSIATIWWTFGFPMLIYIAGLQNIPDTPTPLRDRRGRHVEADPPHHPALAAAVSSCSWP